MVNGVEVIGITTARAGSKGIKNKNTVNVAGKPLIAWTFEEVKKSRYIDVYCVLTNDDNVKFIAKQYGVTVVDEPEELAGDSTGPTELLSYILERRQSAITEDSIVADIRATNPTKLVHDIDGTIMTFANHPFAEIVCGVSRVFDHHPARVKQIVGNYLSDFFPETSDQRQKLLPLAYVRNGSIYVQWASSVAAGINQRNSKKIVPWIMPPERSVNIDEPTDILVAEYYLRQRNG